MSRKQYIVTVSFTQSKPITVWASDEDEAQEKAVEIVLGWSGIDDAEAEDCEEA